MTKLIAFVCLIGVMAIFSPDVSAQQSNFKAQKSPLLLGGGFLVQLI